MVSADMPTPTEQIPIDFEESFNESPKQRYEKDCIQKLVQSMHGRRNSQEVESRNVDVIENCQYRRPCHSISRKSEDDELLVNSTENHSLAAKDDADSPLLKAKNNFNALAKQSHFKRLSR